MTNTKIYNNMTVTVTCSESEDVEMINLINKFKETQKTHEFTEKSYAPKIKAIGEAKWIVIVNQLLELCKVAEELDIRNQLSNFMYISFSKDDTGERYILRLGRYSPLNHYILTYGYAGRIYQDAKLLPVEGYCPKNELEDKDGWLSKWDEYDIYNKFRSKLMKEIQRRTEIENAKTNEIIDRYNEFAKIDE